MSDRLHITNEMRQLDRKNRCFYDELTPDERKQFSLFPMIRWMSAVEGSRDLQEFYVIATNERLNKNFFNINSTQHRKLQWLMATTVSPGMGTPRHNWIGLKKKEPGAGSIKKQLAELFPHYKPDEIDVMAAITTKKELDQYIKAHGRDSK